MLQLAVFTTIAARHRHSSPCQLRVSRDGRCGPLVRARCPAHRPHCAEWGKCGSSLLHKNLGMKKYNFRSCRSTRTHSALRFRFTRNQRPNVWNHGRARPQRSTRPSTGRVSHKHHRYPRYSRTSSPVSRPSWFNRGRSLRSRSKMVDVDMSLPKDKSGDLMMDARSALKEFKRSEIARLALDKEPLEHSLGGCITARCKNKHNKRMQRLETKYENLAESAAEALESSLKALTKRDRKLRKTKRSLIAKKRDVVARGKGTNYAKRHVLKFQVAMKKLTTRRFHITKFLGKVFDAVEDMEDNTENALKDKIKATKAKIRHIVFKMSGLRRTVKALKSRPNKKVLRIRRLKKALEKAKAKKSKKAKKHRKHRKHREHKKARKHRKHRKHRKINKKAQKAKKLKEAKKELREFEEDLGLARKTLMKFQVRLVKLKRDSAWKHVKLAKKATSALRRKVKGVKKSMKKAKKSTPDRKYSVEAAVKRVKFALEKIGELKEANTKVIRYRQKGLFRLRKSGKSLRALAKKAKKMAKKVDLSKEQEAFIKRVAQISKKFKMSIDNARRNIKWFKKLAKKVKKSRRSMKWRLKKINRMPKKVSWESVHRSPIQKMSKKLNKKADRAIEGIKKALGKNSYNLSDLVAEQIVIQHKLKTVRNDKHRKGLKKAMANVQGFKYAMKQFMRICRQELILLTHASLRIHPDAGKLANGKRVMSKGAWTKRAIKIGKIIDGIQTNIKDMRALSRKRDDLTKKVENLEKRVEEAEKLKDGALIKKAKDNLKSAKKLLKKLTNEYKQKAQEDQSETAGWAKQMKIKRVRELAEVLYD